MIKILKTPFLDIVVSIKSIYIQKVKRKDKGGKRWKGVEGGGGGGEKKKGLNENSNTSNPDLDSVAPTK